MHNVASKIARDFLIFSSDAHRDAFVERFAAAIHSMIYNMVSMISVVTLTHGTSLVTKAHVESMHTYTRKACSLKPIFAHAGGSMPIQFVNPSQFPGTYEANPVHSHTGMDLGAGLIRGELVPTMSTMSGGASSSIGGGVGGDLPEFYVRKTLNPLTPKIKAMFHEYKLRLKKEAYDDLFFIIYHHIKCLLNDVRGKAGKAGNKTGVVVGIARFNAILHMKKHAIFI